MNRKKIQNVNGNIGKLYKKFILRMAESDFQQDLPPRITSFCISKEKLNGSGNTNHSEMKQNPYKTNKMKCQIQSGRTNTLEGYLAEFGC